MSPRHTTGRHEPVTATETLDPDTDGCPYIVTRLVDGQVRRLYLRALNGAQASRLADTVTFAHRSGADTADMFDWP